MFNFVKKLMFSRQLKMEEGELVILGYRCFIIPSSLMQCLINLNSDDVNRILYNTAKEGGVMFSKTIKQKYGFISESRLEEILLNVLEMAGLGKFKILKIDREENVAVIHVVSPPSKDLKMNKPADHILRGFLAGGSQVARDNKELECVETECTACGSRYCEFITAPKTYLKKSHINCYNDQVKQ